MENGVVEARRLFDSPYTDIAPSGPLDLLYPETEVELIVDSLHRIRGHARPAGVAWDLPSRRIR